jgi:hypothetical protein
MGRVLHKCGPSIRFCRIVASTTATQYNSDMRSSLLTGFVVLAFAVSACSSSGGANDSAPNGNDGGSETTVAGPTNAANTGNGALPSDACSLLSAGQVEAAIGKAAEGNAAPPRDDNGVVALVGCTWGSVASEDPAIAVQVGKPAGEAQIDYLKALTGAAAQSAQPIDVGTEAKLLGTAFLPGGGGVGQSVIFEQDDMTVVVGMVRGEQENLEAAAKAVAANLS